MDFGIPDDIEEKKKFDNIFFSNNIITFINFPTFEQAYLSTFPYNGSYFCDLGTFLLGRNNENGLLVEGMKTR